MVLDHVVKAAVELLSMQLWLKIVRERETGNILLIIGEPMIYNQYRVKGVGVLLCR